MKSAIIYSSTDGQTKKICEVIKEYLLNKDENKLIPIDNISNVNLENFDNIIIGASIRYGKHNPKILKFVKKNFQLLKTKKMLSSLLTLLRVNMAKILLTPILTFKSF